MIPYRRIVLALFISACLLAFAQAKPLTIPVKVVVLTMFEVGADTGDQPGGLPEWVERDHLDRIYPLAAGHHAVCMNNAGEMAVLTGQVPRTPPEPSWLSASTCASTCPMPAGSSPVSPDRISLGSAAWAHWVVDGNLSYEIDARETPQDSITGYLPLPKSRPFEDPAAALAGQVLTLNETLAAWAFRLTRSTPLADSEHLKEIRSNFDGAAAAPPPLVTMGMNCPPRAAGTASSSTPGPPSGCPASPAARVSLSQQP
jgi:purine nucleoside permease